MLGCCLKTEGCLTLCYHVVANITDLTLTLRYYAINDQLDVTFCYCVTVGAEFVLT